MTQCSIDRLAKLEAQVRSWNGWLSAAVYVSTATELQTNESLESIKALIQRLDADLTFSGCLTVSILLGHEDSPWKWDDGLPGAAAGPLYPINALRCVPFDGQHDKAVCDIMLLLPLPLPCLGTSQWRRSSALCPPKLLCRRHRCYFCWMWTSFLLRGSTAGCDGICR